MTEPDRIEQGLLDPHVRGVLEVARGVLGDLDLERVLDRVLASARELTGARYAAIGVLDESRTRLARFITAGVDDDAHLPIGPEPTGRGVLGELIANPVPLRVANVGSHPRSYGFPAGHPAMETFLGVPVLIGGEPFGNLYLTEKQGGGEFTDLDQEALTVLAEFAGVAVDHARRYSGSEAERHELQRSVRALDVMVEISHAIGGQTDLDQILRLVAKRGRALISAGALVIELQVGGAVEVAAAAGKLPDGLIGRRVALKDSVAGAALRTGRTQRLEDQLNRARFDEHGLGRLGLVAEAGLVVPLIFHGQSFGVLIAVDRLVEGPQFTAEDQRMLEAFAVSVATAVATAQSVAADRRRQRLAAAEEERARWARELHDETLQGMAALRLGLSAARRGGGLPALEQAVNAAIDQLQGDIASLRSLITELRPAALDELGLHAAIRALAARAASSGLALELTVSLADEQGRAGGRLTPELEIATYRVVQEALTNATKHGRAHHAVVEITEHKTAIELIVRDDGAGFNADEPTIGFGLLGMRERVELLHGTLEIISNPGQGTTVRGTLPVQRRTAHETPADLASAGG